MLERGPAEPVGTIVCVHGNPTWSYLWKRVLRDLGDRYRVVAVDQLGMGFSERTPPRSYATRVLDLTDAIAALVPDGPIVIVGQDWGGAVAMGWAVAHPERLAGLVLANTGIAVPSGRSAPWLIRLAASGPITDLVGRRTSVFVEGTLRLSGRRIDRTEREAFRAPYRSAADRTAIAEFVADVPFTTEHPSSGAIASVAAQLAGVTAPTLIAWGSSDPVFDDSFALDLAGRLPHAQLQRVRGIGHLSPIETDLAGTMRSWLEEHVEHDRAEPRPLAAAPAGYVPTWAALDDRGADDSVAFVDGATGTSTSFAELHRRVMGIAGGLASLGLAPGDRVAMLVPPSADLVAAVYAVWRAGGVTVIADRGLGLRGLGRAVRGAGVDWVIGDPKALAAAKALRWAPRARFVAVGSRSILGRGATLDSLAASGASLPSQPDADDLAAVLFTSGATGPAKGVRYRHRQLAAQRDALARTYGITRDDRLVAAFAPFALYGPALGIASTIPDVDVTEPGTLTAEALAGAVGSIDATVVFASPAALANVLRTATALDAGASFAGLRLVLSAGAPVPVATLRSVAERCPNAELHTPYGMTECLPVADVSLVEIDDAGAGRGVCVGHPVPGADVLIVPLGFDPSASVAGLACGTTGEVLVDTPWLSDGYDRLWRTEHDARPCDDAGRVWHRSGDVGHVDARGQLWIEGRSVHVVHADGGPVTPVPVEIAVERIVGFERCAAVGVGPIGVQQLVVVLEQAGAPDGLADADDATRVREVVDHPVAAVLRVGALPVDIRHNTKIDRTLVARWAAGVLAGESPRRPW